MPAPGIRFEQVWKKFRRGAIHDSLRDMIPALAKRLVGRRKPPEDEVRQGDFWAIRDVSFEVKEGETLGIIGGNGAGKSTALRLLTGILRPTRGVCSVVGRVGALIEISAGFHPDLTGRENIFLQGAISGMSRALIQKQFDAIVEFSGIEEFIDTPVKRYSSGMNARLGFAIAAHLDPEVLMIDEVLAVGDFGFQSKAFDRIHQMATSGIPVVLVSHQLDRITELCTKTILLDHGAIACAGTATECIARYTQGNKRESEATSSGPVRITTLRALTDLPVASGSDLDLVVSGSLAQGATRKDGDSVRIKVINSHSGHNAFETTTGRLGVLLPAEGDFSLNLRLQMNLPTGVYRIEVSVFSEESGTVVSKGPAINVQISSAFQFVGSAQLNPRLEIGPGKR